MQPYNNRAKIKRDCDARTKKKVSVTYRVGQTVGHRLMTIILSNLSRLKKLSLEDSLINLYENGLLHMLLHYLLKY